MQKTGYISEAGRCVVMQATLHGRKLIMVLLDSAGRYSRLGDAERIRKWLTESRSHGRARRAPAQCSRQSAVAQRRRDLSRRCLHAIEPAFFQAIGRCRDRQPGDELALVVEDAGGHAAHTHFKLFVVARHGVVRAPPPVPAPARPISVMLLRVWPASPVRVA